MEWSNDKEMTFLPNASNYSFTIGFTPETTYEIRLITLSSCDQRISATVNLTTISMKKLYDSL